jgi:peptide/nickel transport system substrate-binding protein
VRKWVFLIVVYTVNLSFCTAADKITIAISATPNNLSPFFSTDANSQNIDKLLHLSLVDFNDKMQVVCKVCESFSDRVVKAKEIISFRIRKDLTFSDGAPVTVQDVVNSWDYFAKNLKIKSIFMNDFKTIETVKIKNNNEVEIVYKKFSLENISNLALLKIVKIKNTDNKFIELEDIIGCGDYRLESSNSMEIKLQPRSKNKPKLIFKVVKDETTLALKLINKEIDLSVANMSPRKIAWLRKQDKIVQSWEIPSANYLFMGLNHNKVIFKDRRIRQALSLLIPRNEILLSKLKNSAVLSTGMFSPVFSEMYEVGTLDQYDPVRAIKLLQSAGIGTSGKKLQLDWKISNNKASIEIAEVIKHYFEKAGIIVDMSVQEWGTYMTSFKNGKFDIVIGQWVGFNGPNMLNFVYHSKSVPPFGANRTSYKNAEVDKLLEQSAGEINKVKRLDLYKKANRILQNDYAAISLWHPNVIWVGSKCLKNVELTPTGSFENLTKVEKVCEK